MQEAQFTVRGAGLGEADLLGLWRQLPTDGMVSFAAGADGAEEEEEIVWSVVLPADAAAARKQMTNQAQAVQQTKADIAAAGEALAAVGPLPAGESVSFAIGSERQAVTPAEQALLASLRELRGEGSETGAEDATVSFGLGSMKVPAGLEESAREFREFMDSSFRLLRPTLRVETSQGDILTGFSLVGIDGDNDTCWQGRPDLAAMGLHRDSIEVSLQSRLALLQLIGQITVGAAGLATKFAIPGGAVMAMPAAYRYLRTVIDQAKKFNQLHSQRR